MLSQCSEIFILETSLSEIQETDFKFYIHFRIDTKGQLRFMDISGPIKLYIYKS